MRSRAARLAPMIVGTVVFQLLSANVSFGGYLTDLAGYYQFNGNGNDSSGNGNNLTLVGSPGFGPGLFGQSLDLHADNSQYAQGSSNVSAFNFGSSDFTIQVWINFNDFTKSVQTLLEKFDGQTGPGWSISKVVGGQGQQEMEFYGAGAVALDSSALNLTNGTWNQVIVRRSGNQFDLFYDDQLVASAVSSAAITSTTNPLLVGKRNADDGRDFSLNGSLDETAIWNRALSDSEIAGLYNGGRGLNLLSVPEPSSLTLVGLAGAIGTAGAAWRRRKSAVHRRPMAP